jgi:hypothetical protein
MKDKANEIVAETNIPDILEADLPSIKTGDEVILLNDLLPYRKWIVKKMIGNDLFIETDNLLSLPKNATLKKSGKEALVMAGIGRVVLFSEDTGSLQDTPTPSIPAPSIDTPYSRINTPDTFATASGSQYDPRTPVSPASSVNTIYDPNAPTDSAENAAFYDQQKLRLQTAKNAAKVDMMRKQGLTQGESSISSVSTIYDPNAPTDSAENAAFYEQQKLRLRQEKQQAKNTGNTLDFENTNYVSIKPNTNSDDNKLGILTMDKEESKVEEKTDKDDSSVKKIISLTGL